MTSRVRFARSSLVFHDEILVVLPQEQLDGELFAYLLAYTDSLNDFLQSHLLVSLVNWLLFLCQGGLQLVERLALLLGEPAVHCVAVRLPQIDAQRSR